MAVPDYQTLMSPVLHALADGAEQSTSQLRGVIAKQVGLTDEDLKATLPSGSRLFVNRLHWTITYLYQAGLVRRPRRAVVQITGRGQAVLTEHPDRVDNSILLQFKEFTEFQGRARGDTSPTQASANEPAPAAEPLPWRPSRRQSPRLTALSRRKSLIVYGNGNQYSWNNLS